MPCKKCEEEFHRQTIDLAICETRKLRAHEKRRLLEGLMIELLSKIDSWDDPMDSFERQYHCGELNELLGMAYAAVGKKREDYRK